MKTMIAIVALCVGQMAARAQLSFITNNYAITITGFTGFARNIVIPGATNGYLVTTIGANAFASKAFVNSVTIPDSVTVIGDHAFYNCVGLTNVTMGNSVAYIADWAFGNCHRLTNVIIPDSVNSIGQWTFFGCSGLGDVTIPDQVFSLGFQSFSFSGLTSVTIGAGVYSIGNLAFFGSVGLTNIIVIPGNISYASPGGVLFSHDLTRLIQYPAGRLGSYSIPIDVANIGDGAFGYCRGLTSVMIPDNVSSIGSSTFEGCSGLLAFIVDSLSSYYSSMDGVLFDRSGSLLIQYPGGRVGDYAIPYGVATIGGGAFAHCSGLTSASIPTSVTAINNLAFSECLNLTNIAVTQPNLNYSSSDGVLFNKNLTTLIQWPGGLAGSYAVPAGVTEIGDYAFFNCSHLTSVTLDDQLSSLGTYAFGSCSGLTSVTIGINVSSIGTYAFYACSKLHQAYFQGSAPSVNGGSGSADTTVFSGESGTAFFLPGTTGWSGTFGGWPTAAGSYQPQPQILGSDYGLGAQSNRFQFTISWATNTSVVVLASTNLLDWVPVITNTLVKGTNAFTDSTWTNYPQRFYRVRSN